MSGQIVTVAGIVRMGWPNLGLYCDRCDKPYAGPARCRDGERIRAEASADGWLIRAGLDLCPQCRKEAQL